MTHTNVLLMGVPGDLKSYSLSLLSHVHKDQFALCLYEAVKCACVGSLSEEDEESPASCLHCSNRVAAHKHKPACARGVEVKCIYKAHFTDKNHK